MTTSACSVRVRGVVQGVGFRPFVFRLARAHTLAGWVMNGEQGVEIHLEGADGALDVFCRELTMHAPSASLITEVAVEPRAPAGLKEFTIRESGIVRQPSACISPDLPVCSDCLAELFDPSDPRSGYPYINCTHCGPRYSVILDLPYDRPNTTMRHWPLDACCAAEYDDPGSRRFHAQPVACPACGPQYFLQRGDQRIAGAAGIAMASGLLTDGLIIAVKGLGGYHLACDAAHAAAVRALRDRKYRKEQPFALMVRDLERARTLVDLSPAAEALLTSPARPIVLAHARAHFPGVAPDQDELGLMLPYTPLHWLLFAAGAPPVLVMTSANRSSEPIAHEDQDALNRLTGIADAFLIGERPIARRVDDSVVRAGALGPTILRRSRGYAPGAVARLPIDRPVLAVGADLKNTVTLVVEGQAFVGQHIGDLEHYEGLRALRATIADLVAMYAVKWEDLLVAHDAHPQYASTQHALELPASSWHAVQHHRAHVASVLAEHEAWDEGVVGVSLDGTGYGDDGTVWGGELFVGSVRRGFERVAHLRPALLAGGDAAARHPIQAAAGFLADIDDLPDLHREPFAFPPRYADAARLVTKRMRVFGTTSMGRLFDTAAALLGFTREITFEGQAAMWLEHQARAAPPVDGYPFPFADGELDYRPLLTSLVVDRRNGRQRPEMARAFQRGVAEGLAAAVGAVGREHGLRTVVLSGGVFQNELLLQDLRQLLARPRWRIWTNHVVPANDGGISLGQAAIAAIARAPAPGPQPFTRGAAA